MRKVFLITLLFAFVFVLSGCTTTEQGTVIGGLGGAGLGAVIGNQSGQALGGAAIGGVAGAVAGALIGNQMD